MKSHMSVCSYFLMLSLVFLVLPVHSATDIALADAQNSKRHALIVGAWKYPGLDKRFQLKGPKNDAIVVREALLKQGFTEENIHVLADEVEGANGIPTREAIMGVLSDFADIAKAGKGDYFYLHFAGHGSQQPAMAVENESDREADGLDEIFLPEDVGKWSDGIGAVDNAIADDEIGDAIMSMRSQGAFVWAVFDSCHSGTMTRGVKLDEVRMRKVTPVALGIPQLVLDKVNASSVRTRGGTAVEDMMLEVRDGDDLGGFVAFYAAQTTEQTPEMRLPAGDPNRQSMGLFSFTLMQVVANNPGITYRQAMQQVLHSYAGQRVRRPTPMAEGSSLDAPVFGTSETERLMQWPVTNTQEGITVSGGSLHQLSNDSILSVVPSPAAGDDEVIGYLRVTEAQLLQSEAISEEYNGRPTIDVEKLPKGAQARLEVSKLSLSLRVALPQKNNTNEHYLKRINKILKRIQESEKEEPAGLLLEWVDAGKDADVHLAVIDGGAEYPDLKNHLWLLPPTGELIKDGASKSPSITLHNKSDDELQAVLTQSLTSIAKVTNLMRMVSHVSQGEGSASKVAVSLSVTRAEESNKQNGCKFAEGEGNDELIQPSVMSKLYKNDGLRISIKNKGKSAADVTLLFVDSYYGVQVLYPIFKGQTTRLEANAKQSYCIPVTVSTVGIEHVLSIVVPAISQSVEADFGFLSQDSIPKTRGKVRTFDGYSRLFEQAGFGGQHSTRGLIFAPQAELEDISMRLFSWETVSE